jgi:dihydroorotate dehydrogenase
VIARLQKLPRNRSAVLGINIGKNKATELEHAVADYVELFRKLKDYGDYFVLNVSSPNTPELRKLQEPGRLTELFEAIAAENDLHKPVMVKLAPDLSPEELRASVDAALSCSVAGFIVSNTTFGREGLSRAVEFQGGLSGAPLFKKALGCVKAVAEVCAGQVPIIGVGGISSAHDTEQMLEAGASLVQLYSAMVFEGPGLPARILRGLGGGSTRVSV